MKILLSNSLCASIVIYGQKTLTIAKLGQWMKINSAASKLQWVAHKKVNNCLRNGNAHYQLL